ncbi:MAG: alpha/beta hydrolase [Bacteroidota bacterium]
MKGIAILLNLLLVSITSNAQSIPYGNNPAAGKYIETVTAKLYYETYGSGTPLLLLHGDTFGYIDEFAQYIPLLAENFKVIAVGMRGHGKSELGTNILSYKLFAEDAIAILKKEQHETALVMGFSAGAITAYYLAANFPDTVEKVVALGGMTDSSGYFPASFEQLRTLTAEDCEKLLPDLVAARKALMPRTHTYEELIEALRASWLLPTYMDREKVASIKCPVLNIGGDSDHYIDPVGLADTHNTIPKSQLAIIPNCGHVGLIMKPDMIKTLVIPFLMKP